ncbi:MAG TPA: hypothetical protein VGH96_10980 [Streptosporangiaceae bacterium]
MPEHEVLDVLVQALAMAAGLGAPSSSCSYAVVALVRRVPQGCLHLGEVFEIASTNLVTELGIILAVSRSSRWRSARAEL